MDSKWISRLSLTRSTSFGDEGPLSAKLRRYFDLHPEESPRAFVLQAMRREIGERERRDNAENGASRESPPTEEDIRIHAWLSQRLAMVSQERQSLWGRTRHFLGNFLPV